MKQKNLNDQSFIIVSRDLQDIPLCFIILIDSFNSNKFPSLTSSEWRIILNFNSIHFLKLKTEKRIKNQMKHHLKTESHSRQGIQFISTTVLAHLGEL